MSSPPPNPKHTPSYKGTSTKPKLPPSPPNNAHLEHAPPTKAATEPPELVKSMSHEERVHAEKLLVRKIDARLLPAAIVMYIMNYLDRNNIAAARIAGPRGEGLQDELGLTSTQYQPGLLFFLSSWYTRRELGLRTALLYSGSLISGAFSGLITAGITSGLTEARGLRAWRWMFIIEGSVTVVIALGAYFVLPNFPRTTTWLTDEERQLAVWRLEEDIGQDDWPDPSPISFLPWFKRFETLLLTAPPYFLAVITALANAWHADRTGERYWHITCPLPEIRRVLHPSRFTRPKLTVVQIVVAFSVDCATAVLSIIAATILRFILVRLNKKLDNGEHVEGAINSGAAVPGGGEAAEKGFRFLI
ncbi:hypothetical protein BLS_008852 [Venturia inaequalis]|uniref:Uncharacterized protein n=1 Tax=Venturia inaequalis TaxID=5025 RepID=A0A8H3U6M4_VENIN|nr:hypothetical protein BLS_008852 [Venturia inaequalis]